jgi:hypothetical protein
MVAMPDVTPVRVSRDDDVRSVCPYQPDDFLAELGRIFQALVFVAQEYDLPDPEHFGRAKLLAFPDFGQRLRFHAVIAGAFIAVGTHCIDDFPAFRHPFDHGTGYTKLGVIRVWRNDKDIGFLNWN